MIKYKLTNQNMQTYNGFQWKLGEWQEAQGSSEKDLCTDGWLHCYDSPLLAILQNPRHADIKNPRLWEVEVAGDFKNDKGLKCGYRKMRLVKEIKVPKITTEQKIKYAILCAKQVYLEKKWNIWADNWLSNINRTAPAPPVVYIIGDDAYVVANSAAHAAASAADAHAAAHATYAVATYAAADATAAHAAYAAYAVATYAAAVGKKINLVELAEECMK